MVDLKFALQDLACALGALETGTGLWTDPAFILVLVVSSVKGVAIALVLQRQYGRVYLW